jgi:hypothetical protein
MTKMFAMVVSLALIVTLAVSPVWAVGDKVRSEKAAGPAGTTGGGEAEPNRGTTIGPNDQLLDVLTDAEIEDIIYIREEEKLARDVYITLYQIWKEPIFENISKSEQNHMDAIKGLIDKYGLEDPVVDDTLGAFANPEFIVLYNSLITSGSKSYCEALDAGKLIEETDIVDIENALMEVTAQDVGNVFENLKEGSLKHLGAFESQIDINCE